VGSFSETSWNVMPTVLVAGTDSSEMTSVKSYRKTGIGVIRRSKAAGRSRALLLKFRQGRRCKRNAVKNPV